MWYDATLALIFLARDAGLPRVIERDRAGRGLLAIIHGCVRDEGPCDRPEDGIRRTSGRMEYRQLSRFAQPLIVIRLKFRAHD